MELSRRNFLAGLATAGIGAAGMSLAACSPAKDQNTGDKQEATTEVEKSASGDWLGKEPEISDADVEAEEECDVVVIGLGNAGVMAYRSAAEAGANTIAIEKAESYNATGGAFALIMGAITPAGGNIKLNQLINTPKEFQGKEFNILVTGVDRSSTGDLSAGAANDSNVNDGMTDMVLYVHFNNETGEMKMLQIPRDTMVTTDASVSGNYRINGVAKTQGSDSNNNMAALCELIADQYKLPIDGFITIRLEMLTELVDLFGGVEINVPVDVDYAALGLGDSVIHAGYQTLNGASMEFLLRARKIYPDGDIGRLNMQRQFYAALFRKLKSIGNIWDVAKLTPAVLNYMETNLSASDLISFAISMLKIDSSKIMICQMPVISGPQYNGQSLLYPARQADADLLNQYFRENTGPVDASQLNLCDNVIDLSGYTATDPNIQQMGGLMAAADDAQKNENLDGSNQVTDIMASESTAESESTDTDSTDTESQPAA